MATVRTTNHNEPITAISELPRAPIPILVSAPVRQRDGRSVFPTPKVVRGRERLVLQQRDLRIVPRESLEQFVDSRKRRDFEKQFGPVPDEDRKELIYLLNLGGAVSESKQDLQRALAALDKAVRARSEGEPDIDHHLYVEARQTPAYALCRIMNRGIQRVRFIVWWVERERRLAPGLYCEDTSSALFALALVSLGGPGSLCVCLRCGTPFFARRGKQVYCSYRCQTAAAMMRYRANKKQREKLSARVSKRKKRMETERRKP